MKFKTILLLSILFLIQISCGKEDESNNEEQISITLSDFKIDFNELPQANKSIGFIQGNTNKGGLTFSIISQSPENSMTINPETGELRVLNESLYDFDINPIITGTVNARNGEVSKNCNITITVINIERIYNGSILLQSQEQLDSFGANKYDRINGTLTLYGSGIVNANSLSSIKFIDGDLLIGATNIENVDWLQNVNLLDDSYIFIEFNNKLKNLNGLQNITARLSNLEIWLNPLLENIDGLKNITNVIGRIYISENYKLKNLNGLSGIKNPLYNVYIIGNLELVNTDGLSNIPKIYEYLSFGRNDLVSSLNFSNLVEAKYIIISDNRGIKNINFGSLKTCTNLDLSYNNNLLNIDSFSNLETCSKIGINDNSKLENLNGLVNLKQVEGSVSISSNSSLSNFCGLTLLASIYPNKFYIGDNYYNPTKDDINNGNCSN